MKRNDLATSMFCISSSSAAGYVVRFLCSIMRGGGGVSGVGDEVGNIGN